MCIEEDRSLFLKKLQGTRVRKAQQAPKCVCILEDSLNRRHVLKATLALKGLHFISIFQTE